MALEAVAALVVAVAVLWLVLQPLINPALPTSAPLEPLDPEETPKGIALAALKEIEFDRETGKLSDADYEYLKAKYTSAALEALREEHEAAVSDDVEALIAAKVRALRSASAPASSNTSALACVTCGPRPEAGAVFCSTCGGKLGAGS
jgi:rRNA maturation endonuclease Nob1